MGAAESVFAEKGFSFTKVSDIAAAAGLSHGLVYHYFASKEELFGTLIDELLERIDGEFDRTGATALARLERTLETVFGQMQASPESMQLMTQAMLIGGLPSALREAVFERSTRLIERMMGMIRECQEAGEIVADIDPVQLTTVLACVMRGMSVRPPGGQELPMPMPTVSTLKALLRPHLPAERGSKKTHATDKS